MASDKLSVVLRQVMLTLAALATLSFAVSVTGAGPTTAEDAKPVAVVNSPVVQAQQAGSWNVNIGNASANPIPVRDVDSPARAVAYLHRFFCNIPEGAVICSSSDSLPPGMRLVVETISLEARSMELNQKPLFALSFDVNGESRAMQLPLINEGIVENPAGQRYSAAHNVRLYTDAASEITASFSRDVGIGSLSTRAWVSGYLVECASLRGVPGCPAP